MQLIPRLSAAAALLSCTAASWAHDGHGLAGSHWHASDTAGFVFVVVLATIAIWLSRGGK